MNRKLVIIVLLLLVPTCVGILSGIIYAVQATGQIVRDAYASDWTTEFVIAHLRANDNRWPTGWHDLKDEFDTLAAPQQYAWTFIELKDRVWLDWDADPQQIAISDPLQIVFRLRSGRRASYGGDPNERIRDYLSSQSLAVSQP